MNRLQRIRTFFALLALAALAASCGGGAPDPSDLQDLKLQIAFPTGTSFAASGLSLETPYGSAAVSASAGTVSVTAVGYALTSVSNASGVLLMGFVSPTQTKLSPRTTAEVLAFYALNAQSLEPAMQSSMISFLAASDAVTPVATAVEGALRAAPPLVSSDQPAIRAALAAMKVGLGVARAGDIKALSVTVAPEYQASGLLVRETAPLADAANVYNNFRREVFVYVERTDPSPTIVTSFALEGASVETLASAQKFQALLGFAGGDVPRSAIKSSDVALPAVNEAATTYTFTVVGAGGDALPATLDATKAQKARDLALRTAIERFIVPTISSALEAGAKERSASDLAPILQGISSGAIDQIEAGNFAEGVNAAFRDLFVSSALPTTVSRVLRVYYPNIRSKDGLENMRSRLTRAFSSLIGATASGVTVNGSAVIGTINRSKRLESFTVVTKPVKLRVSPAQSYLGKGGQASLKTDLQLPPNESASGVTYRWSLTGAGAGYANDNGTEKAFPFETTSATVLYKHRDTINVVYGTDTITVEAIRSIANTPTVIAKGSASVTVKESTITLTPQNAELAFGEEQTLTATVNPAPASGTLSYVFVTFGGPSTFVGGAQTSLGSGNTARFRQSDDTVGNSQPVTVDVVLEDAGVKTILGQAKTTIKVKDDPGLLNGDFSQGLTSWRKVNVKGGVVSIGTAVSYGCLPSQNGNPFVAVDVYRNQDAYIEQTFKVPSSAKTLSVRTANSLDPVVVTISLISNGAETALERFTPPSLQRLSDPDNLYSVVCTGSAPVTRSYPVTGFVGKTVTLRLRASNAPGYNGTIAIFDDVRIGQ